MARHSSSVNTSESSLPASAVASRTFVDGGRLGKGYLDSTMKPRGQVFLKPGRGRGAMRRQVLLGLGPVFAVFLVAAVPTQASTQAPPFETRKITEHVYIFRYVGHQSMFVVTPDGVIATDPIGYLRPQAVTTYIAEIRKVTPAPIKYVVYSHHHYDHIPRG